jgi:SpoVK/Ycf46/Vps4 family AAA+-type ATPase
VVNSRKSPDTPFTRMLRDRRPAFTVSGLPPNADPTHTAMVRTRLIAAAESFAADGTQGGPLSLTVSNQPAEPMAEVSQAEGETQSLADRASYFEVTDPLYTFDFLVLPSAVRERLIMVVETLQHRDLIFDKWNLRAIEPHPSSAINLHGAPGTGKTLAAHAIADRLGKKILSAKYSQLESKYHGEGPKNLDALFHAARENDAVLFLDEADSLMSRRFENTSQGSEHATNAMRSELIMSLDRYEGLVVFATNFVVSYDSAFDSRVRHVEFPQPDSATRALIWQRHLPRELPLAPDVSVTALAEVDGVSGREIRRAVIDAATRAAVEERAAVCQADLLGAINEITASRIVRPSRTPNPVPEGSPLHQQISEAAQRVEGTDQR